VTVLRIYLWLFEVYICDCLKYISVSVLSIYLWLFEVYMCVTFMYICDCFTYISVTLLRIYLWLIEVYTCDCLTYISVIVLRIYLWLFDVYICVCFLLRRMKSSDWLEDKIYRLLCYRYLSGHFPKTFNSILSVPFYTYSEEAEGNLKRSLFMQLHSISSTVSSCLPSPLLQAICLVQWKGLFDVCDICNPNFQFLGDSRD